MYDDMVFPNVLPVWLRSRLCNLTGPMGHPSVNAMRALPSNVYIVSRTFKEFPYENQAVNNMLIPVEHDGRPQIKFRSDFVDWNKKYRTNATFRFTCEVSKARRSTHTQALGYHTERQQAIPLTSSTVSLPEPHIQFPHEKTKLPTVVVAGAYGCDTDTFVRRVTRLVRAACRAHPVVQRMLERLREARRPYPTQETCIAAVSKCYVKCKSLEKVQAMSYTVFELRTEIFPHLYMEDDVDRENDCKAWLLALITANMFQRFVRPPAQLPDAGRDLRYRVVLGPGERLAMYARGEFKQLVLHAGKELGNTLEHSTGIDLDRLFAGRKMNFVKAVRSGTWDARKDKPVGDHNKHKTDTADMGYCTDSMHASLQKIVKPFLKRSPSLLDRLPHGAHVGRMCVYTAPENPNCGAVNPKTLGALLTTPTCLRPITRLLLTLLHALPPSYGFVHAEDMPPLDSDHVLIMGPAGDGHIMGWIGNALALHQFLRAQRRQGVLDRFVNWAWDRDVDVFRIFTGPRRVTRPLWTVEVLHRLREVPVITGPDTLRQLERLGLLEYLDAHEEFGGLVRVAASHDDVEPGVTTHVELHGLLNFSIPLCKPFLNHDAGARRGYTGNMDKSSQSLKPADLGTHQSLELLAGDRPLVSTVVDEVLQLRALEPNGQLTFAAIVADRSTMEDPYVVNQASIDRGFGGTANTVFVTGILSNPGMRFAVPHPMTVWWTTFGCIRCRMCSLCTSRCAECTR